MPGSATNLHHFLPGCATFTEMPCTPVFLTGAFKERESRRGLAEGGSGRYHMVENGNKSVT